MAKQDASREGLSKLEQAQYEYRKTIYFAGLKILENFSEAVIGPDPSRGGDPTGALAGGPPPPLQIFGAPPGWHINIYVPPPPPPPPCGPGTDGAPPGWHINAIVRLVEVVLSLKPPARAPNQGSQLP